MLVTKVSIVVTVTIANSIDNPKDNVSCCRSSCVGLVGSSFKHITVGYLLPFKNLFTLVTC